MTAEQLAGALAGYAPLIEFAGDGFRYRLRRDTPPGLAAAFAVLKTGVAALATGRPWYGCDGATGRPALLPPSGLVPEGVTLLSAGGCGRWDRLHWAARLDLPELFAAPPPAGATAARAAQQPHRRRLTEGTRR